MSSPETTPVETDQTPSKPRRYLTTRRVSLGLLVIILILGIKFLLHLLLPRQYNAEGLMLPFELTDQPPFQGLFYCQQAQPIGIVVLGTGNGGWSYWEENTAKHLSSEGFAVIGWDYRKYVESRKYTHENLVNGFLAAVEAVYDQTDCDRDIPIWYGGWSTGAEQSIAAAGSSRRPPNLVGLLLAAPASRGRFGLETSDLLGVLPTGKDSFAMTDYAKQLTGLHIAQFAAGLDPMDDTTWLKSLDTPHRIFELPTSLHDMGGAGPAFQALVDQAIHWTLEGTPFESRVEF